MAHVLLDRLNKRFGTLHVLKDVSLAIEEKEFVTLLGPSGCGKTTTLRLIAGFLTPDSGEIRVGGEVISSPQASLPPERRRMGMVFQNYAVWPHMTIFENVAFGLKLQRAATARDSRAGGEGPRGGRPRGARGPSAGPAQRRPAAARGARPLARRRAVHSSPRRAPLEPRRQAPRADAHRAQGPAAPARHHLHLRHA